VLPFRHSSPHRLARRVADRGRAADLVALGGPRDPEWCVPIAGGTPENSDVLMWKTSSLPRPPFAQWAQGVRRGSRKSSPTSGNNKPLHAIQKRWYLFAARSGGACESFCPCIWEWARGGSCPPSGPSPMLLVQRRKQIVPQSFQGKRTKYAALESSCSQKAPFRCKSQ
jgi:hypothetical protein